MSRPSAVEYFLKLLINFFFISFNKDQVSYNHLVRPPP